MSNVDPFETELGRLLRLVAQEVDTAAHLGREYYSAVMGGCLDRAETYLKQAIDYVANPGVHSNGYHNMAADALREQRWADALHILNEMELGKNDKWYWVRLNGTTPMSVDQMHAWSQGMAHAIHIVRSRQQVLPEFQTAAYKATLDEILVFLRAAVERGGRPATSQMDAESAVAGSRYHCGNGATGCVVARDHAACCGHTCRCNCNTCTHGPLADGLE